VREPAAINRYSASGTIIIDWASSDRPQPSCSNMASMMISETKALVTMP
jgi:hypothetical protein